MGRFLFMNSDSPVSSGSPESSGSPGSQIKLARFRPALLDCLKDYSRAKFFTDVMAGVTVGIVALSLCIGFGVASGVTPEAGLYAGIVGGFLVSFFGGSRVQVGGPAGAFVGVLALMGAQYGVANLLLCTMLAGIMLFLMGLFRFGSLIKFVPQPVVVGFTCGIAITIILTQVSAFFGLRLEHEPAEFLPKLVALASAAWTAAAAGSVNWATLGLAAASLVIMLKWPARWQRFAPASIVVVILGTALAWACGAAGWQSGVETIGTRFGGIPRGLPVFAVPHFDWRELNNLVLPAFTIAALGAIESLLSAVVADGLIDDQHDSNQELMGQGVANFVAPFFGGIPVTGVIARTATNIRCGAVSPVAGMAHSVFLLAVLLVAAPLAKNIPLASLAAVLVAVAWKMGEWDEFFRLRKKPKSDAAVFLTTFFLTVFFDLTKAVIFGMVLACVLFIRRVADTTQVHAMMGGDGDASGAGGSNGAGGASLSGVAGGERESLAEPLPKGVVVYRVSGALLFGAVDKLDLALRRKALDARVVIFNMAAVTAMDATALDRLETLREKSRARRRHLILCGPHTQPYFMMAKAGFLEEVGRDNIAADLPAAVERAKALVGNEKGNSP